MNEFQQQLLEFYQRKLGNMNVPLYAQEDANEIIDELREGVDDCKEILLRTHRLSEFKVCAHIQCEAVENRLWDLQGSLVNISNSLKYCQLLPLLVLLLNFILGRVLLATG